MVRQRIARGVAKAFRWRLVGDVPHTGIVVGAPHTSNWDFIVMLMVMWNGGVPPRVLVKKELFKGPLAWVLRGMGAIPTDRHNAAGLVENLVAQARGDKPFLLILAAEGTRTKSEYWKSGFYRLAQQSGLPISLAFVDGPSKTAGFGPTFHVTGDVRADMDRIRDFFADKRGIHPNNITSPRLREEARSGPEEVR